MLRVLVLALVATIISVAASGQTPLATLSHEGNLTSYYGVDALKEAYNAAANGDVISLSAGTFNAISIEKNITIRGAGMEQDPQTGALPTTIAGNFSILTANIADEQYDTVTLESIRTTDDIITYTNCMNLKIIKCSLYRIEGTRSFNDSSTNPYTILILNSKIREQLYTQGSVNCYNSIIKYITGLKYENYHTSLTNCACMLSSDVYRATINNCILFIPSSTYFHSSSALYNNVFTGSNASNLGSTSLTQNNHICDSSIFKESTTGMTATATFELTDEAAATYLGTDGTQVGIYGGSLPYDPTPNNPRITKFNVAPRTTADGKLSVDLSVSAVD